MIEQKLEDTQYIEMIQRACTKLHDIIKTVLTLINHNHSFEPTLVDINHIIRTEVELIKFSPFCHKYVQFFLDLKKIPLIKASPFHLSQVINNLLKNAIEALQEKKQNSEITIHCERGTEYIHIQVQDNGMGMNEAVLEKIFTPLFSTKKEYKKGSGLGLSYCKDIVKQCKGKIWAESHLHKGSTFHLQIPIKTKEQKEVAA